MKKFLFIDIETTHTDAKTTAALDVSAVVVDPRRFVDNPYTAPELLSLVHTFKLSIPNQVQEHGFKVSKSTMAWWAKLSKENPYIAERISPQKTDLSVVQFREQFLSFLEQNKPFGYYWSRSNTFDPIILDRLFGDDVERLRKLLPYWLVRDTRTFIDAKMNFTGDNDFPASKDVIAWDRWLKKHCSNYDVVADVLRMQLIYRAEEGIDPPYVEDGISKTVKPKIAYDDEIPF